VKLEKDLREFIELLNSHRVEFLVVGGHAVGFYGYPRYTGDVDFLVMPTEETASRIAAAIDAFGLADTQCIKNILTQHGKVIQIGRPPNRIASVPSMPSHQHLLADSGFLALTSDRRLA
jgi:hypothetical protein